MTQSSPKSHADDPLIPALLSNTSVRSAANAAGVSETTAYRRLSDKDFCESLQAAKYQVYSHALSRLQTAACEAVSVLVEVAGDTEAPPAARIKAAESILSHADNTLYPPLSSDAGRRLAAGNTSEPSIDALLSGR
jgi:AcrR family transcriptional regulator